MSAEPTANGHDAPVLSEAERNEIMDDLKKNGGRDRNTATSAAGAYASCEHVETEARSHAVA